MLNSFLKYSILIITLNIGLSSGLHAQQFKAFRNATITNKTPLDSLVKIYKNALQKQDTLEIISSLIDLSTINRIHLEFSEAFKYAGNALFLAEEFKDTLSIARAHEEYGVLNYLFKQDESAGENFKKANTYFQIAYQNKQIPQSHLFSSSYNLALYYQRTAQDDLLLKSISKCEQIAKKSIQDSVCYDFLNEKRASIFERKKEYSKAIALLKKSINNLKHAKSFNENKSFLIILNARLGDLYRSLQDYKLAGNYYKTALNIEDSKNENIFYKAYIYSRYAETLTELEAYKDAYKNEFESKKIYQRYLNPRNDDNLGFLTIKNNYNEQINSKNKQLIAQKLELAQQNQKLLRLRVLCFVLLFTAILAALIIRSHIKNIKHQKKEADSKLVIDSKNKELTVNTLQLIEREKVIELLSDHIKKSDLDSTTRTLLKTIDKRSINLWDSFNNRFITQNEGFYERLKAKAPDLSAADLKICALIKLNFTGKEMAYLLGISLGSVHVARHRLRKKMNLDRDVNLSNYINAI
ncbi:helix-turn-helix transcriptional regulator [Formosa haliotis]|uniref:helix-turn-helix transcriptional regulator n=1 Tax=Formosa haliotis TaxID=1555194 RepID=UPI000826BD05|nr:hypothetical protein [Formosa haliotis]